MAAIRVQVQSTLAKQQIYRSLKEKIENTGKL